MGTPGCTGRSLLPQQSPLKGPISFPLGCGGPERTWLQAATMGLAGCILHSKEASPTKALLAPRDGKRRVWLQHAATPSFLIDNAPPNIIRALFLNEIMKGFLVFFPELQLQRAGAEPNLRLTCLFAPADLKPKLLLNTGLHGGEEPWQTAASPKGPATCFKLARNQVSRHLLQSRSALCVAVRSFLSHANRFAGLVGLHLLHHSAANCVIYATCSRGLRKGNVNPGTSRPCKRRDDA